MHRARKATYDQYSSERHTLTACSYLCEARLVKLRLEVVDGVEDGRVLGQEVAEGLGVGLGLGLGDLAEPARMILGDVPVDLGDLAGVEFGDAAGAGTVVLGTSALHVGQDEVLGSARRWLGSFRHRSVGSQKLRRWGLSLRGLELRGLGLLGPCRELLGSLDVSGEESLGHVETLLSKRRHGP